MLELVRLLNRCSSTTPSASIELHALGLPFTPDSPQEWSAPTHWTNLPDPCPFHQIGRMTLAFWKELYFLKAFANLKGMDHGIMDQLLGAICQAVSSKTLKVKWNDSKKVWPPTKIQVFYQFRNIGTTGNHFIRENQPTLWWSCWLRPPFVPMGAQQIIRDLVTQVTTEEPRLVKWRNNQQLQGNHHRVAFLWLIWCN